MATKKISALTELTTPAGTEELIVNAGGTSKKIQIDNLPSSLDDNSVTLAKMASGTDGNLITYDASGDPAYVTTGTSGQILTSGGTGVAPTFQNAAAAGATNIDGLSDGCYDSSRLNLGMGRCNFSCSPTGGCNVAYGIDTLKKLTTGSCNTVMGYRAGYNLTTGYGNTYMGWKAGRRHTNGINNVAMGSHALGYHNACYQDDEATWTGGDHNTAIGNMSAYGMGSGVGCTTNIGYWANKSGAHQTCIMGSDVYIENAAYSDCRAKCDIQTSALGLNFVNALNPVSYKWIPNPDRPLTDAAGNIAYQEKGSNEDDTPIYVLDADGNKVPMMEPGFKAGAKRTHYGLLAQDVKTVLDTMGIDANDFAGYIDQKYTRPDWTPHWSEGGETATKALRYEQFISPMIKAIQELSDRVEALENA